MKREFKNDLLNEYLMQSESVMSEKEKDDLASYVFYDAYDVTIGGWDSDACNGCCCLACICLASGGGLTACCTC